MIGARAVGHVIGWLWALPLTVIGLPFYLWVRLIAREGHAHFTEGVFTVHHPLLKRLLFRHPFGAMHAVALGCCVLAGEESTLKACMAHELVHVQQAKYWGVLFPLAYLASSVWQRFNGRCAYADNWFERQANRDL